MGEAEAAQIAERVKSDREFREKFRADPKAAASSLGLELTDEEIGAISLGDSDDSGTTAMDGNA
jgi:hypothetical protein